MALLTDTKARNTKDGDKLIPHGGITGLSLHPSATKGRGKWVLRYVSPITGKRRNAGLGSYPEVGIADVGKLAQIMREQLTAGVDPLDAKKIEVAKPSIPTLEEAARKLHEELSPGWKNPKHGKQWIATLEQYVFPKIGTMKIDALTPAHVADALRAIWLTKPETASRVKQRLHAVLSWGWAHGHCVSNPVDVVHHLLAQQPGKASRTEHQPAMPWREIPAFAAEHLRVTTRNEVTRPMMEFLILTACRSGEVRGACWSEIDMDAAVWTIPAERMKAKMTHRVPLSGRTLGILKAQGGKHKDLVFPSSRDRVALSDMVLTAFLRRVNAPSDTPGRIATAHGFRSSFRDWCSEQNYSRDLAERALAHAVQNKVEAAYHRTDLLEQRRQMMSAWSDFVAGKLLGNDVAGDKP